MSKIHLTSGKSHPKHFNSIQSTNNQSHIKEDTHFLPFTRKNKSFKSLSSSIISNKSEKKLNFNGIKLPHSFYNDRNQIYLSKSQILSENSVSYKSKQISLSQRKRFLTGKTQNILQKRSMIQDECFKKQTINPEKELNKEKCKEKYKSLTALKYKKLLYGGKQAQIHKRLLQKDIKEINQQKSMNRKWSSPFLHHNNENNKYQGKQLLPKKIERIYGNDDTSQLKVLNLDRLFREKNGIFTNIMPIPQVKMSSVTSRQNMIKQIKNKDKIHDVLDEFNNLLKIQKLNKTIPKIGIRGKNYTKGPTFEELMGIKLKPSKQLIPRQDHQEISQEIFVQYCQFYKQKIKKDVHLTRRLFAGLKQAENVFDVMAFTRFYKLFVNKIANPSQKIFFLIYFFIPEGQERIEFSMLKLILEVMCNELPPIDKLDVKTDLLTNQEKSKIFLEALNRVLFADIQEALEFKPNISRSLLKNIFENNVDATDLLIRLLQLQ